MASKWHAVDSINEAVERTNHLLFKNFRLGFWLKLALVVFLIGGGGFNLNSGFRESGKDGKEFMASVSAYLPIIVVVLAILLIIGLVFAFIRAVCQFVFIDAVATGTIELIKGFKRNLEGGFSLFLFNLGLTLIAILLVLGALLPIMYLIFKGAGGLSTIALVIAFIALVFGIMLFIWLISSLTTDFAIIFMHKEKKGVMDGWRRLWRLGKSNLKQFAVYMAVKIALAIASGIIVFIIALVVTIIALILIIALGIGVAAIVIGGVVALGLNTTYLYWLLIPALIIAIAYFIVVGYFNVLITLPVPVFFRCYSILFLQRLDPTIHVIMKEEKPLGSKKLEEKNTSKKKKTEDLRIY